MREKMLRRREIPLLSPTPAGVVWKTNGWFPDYPVAYCTAVVIVIAVLSVIPHETAIYLARRPE